MKRAGEKERLHVTERGRRDAVHLTRGRKEKGRARLFRHLKGTEASIPHGRSSRRETLPLRKERVAVGVTPLEKEKGKDPFFFSFLRRRESPFTRQRGELFDL